MESRTALELKNEVERLIQSSIAAQSEGAESNTSRSTEVLMGLIYNWLMSEPQQIYERLAACIVLVAENAATDKQYAAIKQNLYITLADLMQEDVFNEFNNKVFYQTVNELNQSYSNPYASWELLTQIYDSCMAKNVASNFRLGFENQFENLNVQDKKMLLANCLFLSPKTGVDHRYHLNQYAHNILGLGKDAYANGIFNIHKYMNERMSQEEVITFAQQMLHSPHQFKPLIALVKKPRKLEIFNAGSNPNNWTVFSKSIMDVLHHKGTVPTIKKDLHAEITNKLADQSPLPTSAIAKEIKDASFIMQLGRTLIFKMPNGRYRAYKVQKNSEDLNDLRKEEVTLKTIQEHQLSLQSKLPQAIATYALSADDQQALMTYASQDDTSKRLFKPEYPHVFVYETDSLDYFKYLHDASLLDAEVLSSAMTSLHDISILAQYNIFCNNLADLYHVSSQARFDREDQGRYLLLNDLIRLDDPTFFQGRGNLSNITEAARYPNLRKRTLADVGDHASLNEMVTPAFKHKPSEMYANFIAEPLLVLELILSHKQITHDHKNHEQWQKTVEILLLAASYQLHLYSQLPLDICHRFIVSHLEENQYTNQLEFWMQPEKYTPHMNANTVPSELYDPQLDVVVDNKAFRKGTYDPRLGFTTSIDTQKFHRGAGNSVDPVIESAKLGYVVGTFGLNSVESKKLFKHATQQMGDAINKNDWQEAKKQCSTALTLNPHSRYLNHVMSTINKKLTGKETNDQAWQKLQRKYREKKFQKNVLKK